MQQTQRMISVIGLGYVGLPVAVAFGKHHRVIGFDINQQRIEELKDHFDRTEEVTSDELKQTDILFSDQITDLAKADFHIVAVPTPVDDAHQPDLTPVLGASRSVAAALKKGDIVVYESTVYPGVTEEICVPVLEQISGLTCGKDFTVGYSPERINPGDKEHTFTKITKVVSGQDAPTLQTVADVYASVVTAGVYKASSIKVAEAAKVIENTQRDLNIALMNELSLLFNMMGIDTQDVLDAAGTKWNFLKFRPGLVGGHCIGVDPYYLTYKAEQLGYIPQVILSGRSINDGMGRFVAQQTIKQLILSGTRIKGCVVTVMGLTFKENCPDLRNTRVIDIIEELASYGIDVQVCDPAVDPNEALDEYGITLVPLAELNPASAIVVAVAHDAFNQLTPDDYQHLLGEEKVIIDVKSSLNRDTYQQQGFQVWRL